MPEVVRPTPTKRGRDRNWDEVFPIWKKENDPDNIEGRVINQVLYAIAMDNRMVGTSREELKQQLLDNALRSVNEYLTEDGMNIEERSKTLLVYGQTIYYINEIFNNLGDVYREHKS